MLKRKIVFDEAIRLVGSLCLTLGALFTVTGLEDRTISDVFLWFSLCSAVAGLIGSFFGKRSWYAGTVILLATYLLMISRYSPSLALRFIALVIALLVGFGGLSRRLVGRNFATTLFIKRK